MLGFPTIEPAASPLLATVDLAVGHRHATVVRNVNLALRAGSFTAVLGSNGCGKSTLLRTMAGLQPAKSGVVEVAGAPLGDHSVRELAHLVSFLPQSPLVPAGVSVRELVTHGRHPHRRLVGALTAADRAAIDTALDDTGLDDMADRSVEHLSGGERQRCWVALALAQQARVVLLDEPTTYLDIRHQLEVLAILRRLADDQQLAVVAVLHDLDQAATFADRLIVIADGAVAADGAPLDVLTPDLVRSAFGVDADIGIDPRTGAPVCRFRLPLPATVASDSSRSPDPAT